MKRGHKWLLLGAGLLALGVSLTALRPWERARSFDHNQVPGALLPESARVARAERFITRLDVAEAEELLRGTTSPAAARAKARLAIYQADCEGALAHLASDSARNQKGAGPLLQLARRCHGATAGARVVVDEERGLWIRVQDEADLVLVPMMQQVLVEARAALSKDLGVELPRPLRLDLVRDLFSLSAVSGLPVDAAETTGTVAVARWGRVTMVSPRAPESGYPWADTLAHELTHLMLSRASEDGAPLWLQEGIAKLEEERWREKRLFDGTPDRHLVAYEAERDGSSVGVMNLGRSIAMLPTASAASIAFAEVSSFMEFWIEENGRPALHLLLRDLAVAPDDVSAMRSVSGLGVAEWELIWREEQRAKFAGLKAESSLDEGDPEMSRYQLGRILRLTELLSAQDHEDRAAEMSAPAVDEAPHVAALRFAAARAAQGAGWADASTLLGSTEDIDGPHAGWLALRAQLDRGEQSSADTEALFEHALSLDPLLVDVACARKQDPGAPGYLQKLCAQVETLVPPESR